MTPAHDLVLRMFQMRLGSLEPTPLEGVQLHPNGANPFTNRGNGTAKGQVRQLRRALRDLSNRGAANELNLRFFRPLVTQSSIL